MQENSMETNDVTFLGLDLAGLITLPTMLIMFAFAVWWAVTRYTVGIDEEEQARRMDAHKRF
jgi:hypothetical protein